MTQTDLVLAHLRTAPITPLQALREYGIMRLGARIYDLRRQGIAINRRMVANGKKHFAEYRLARTV